MKNCKELNFDLAHYYYEKENVLYCKGRTVLTDYKRNLRLDISENFTDTETKLYIFGTEKGLYSFGKYLIDYSAWDCWYDGAHQHYDNIRNRNNVPFINLIIHKLKNIDYIDKVAAYIVKYLSSYKQSYFPSFVFVIIKFIFEFLYKITCVISYFSKISSNHIFKPELSIKSVKIGI